MEYRYELFDEVLDGIVVVVAVAAIIINTYFLLL